MDVQEKIVNVFVTFYGSEPDEIIALPPSGSDRKYFRLSINGKTFVAAYNQTIEENEAFVSFTKHFMTKNLPVPEIYYYDPESGVYFQKDLGDTNLYTWLQRKDLTRGFDEETKELYKKVLSTLASFQVNGVEGLDVSRCYPHKSFDKRSMMWDLNYFKYLYLKLLAVPFSEPALESDFLALTDFLLKAGQKYFLYRDFQTANIMVVNGSPWFIDYQGGRLGAPQYDVASLLYDAKISMNDDDRDELLHFYMDLFCPLAGVDKEEYLSYYSAFSLIRVMQACGAFGFRGLYENKPTFSDSVVPGGYVLQKIAQDVGAYIKLPELYQAISNISKSVKFKVLESQRMSRADVR